MFFLISLVFLAKIVYNILLGIGEKKVENLENYRSFKQVLNEFYKEELEKSEETVSVEKLQYNNIKIIPKFFYDKVYNTLNVEFKLGKDNFYKIKNLKEFFNRINNNESYIYSNKLEFVHNEENFERIVRNY